MASVEAIKVGEAFGSFIGPDREFVEYTVAESCGENHGRWHCVTHDTGFTNNLMKDNHIRNGKHILVWVCYDHGPEQP